jgi:hypothetical protein
MLFHWRQVYGWLASKASPPKPPIWLESWLDDLLQTARTLGGFEGIAANEAEFQRRFEHMAPLFTAGLLGLNNQTDKQWALEGMIERLKIGLLEGRLVGDMKLGPKLRTYAQALHGRVQRYGPLLAHNNTQGLTAALAEHSLPEKYVQTLQKVLAKAAKVG